MKITKRNHIYKVGDIIKLKTIKDVDAIYNKYVINKEIDKRE